MGDSPYNLQVCAVLLQGTLSGERRGGQQGGKSKEIGVILFNIFLHCQAQSGGKKLNINIILALIYAL